MTALSTQLTHVWDAHAWCDEVYPAPIGNRVSPFMWRAPCAVTTVGTLHRFGGGIGGIAFRIVPARCSSRFRNLCRAPCTCSRGATFGKPEPPRPFGAANWRAEGGCPPLAVDVRLQSARRKLESATRCGRRSSPAATSAPRRGWLEAGLSSGLENHHGLRPAHHVQEVGRGRRFSENGQPGCHQRSRPRFAYRALRPTRAIRKRLRRAEPRRKNSFEHGATKGRDIVARAKTQGRRCCASMKPSPRFRIVKPPSLHGQRKKCCRTAVS